MKDNQVAWNGNYNWSKDLNGVYSKKMQSVKFEGGKRIVTKKTLAGFLIKKNGEYFIAPLRENCSERTISIKDKKFDYLKESCVLWDGVAAYTFKCIPHLCAMTFLYRGDHYQSCVFTPLCCHADSLCLLRQRGA